MAEPETETTCTVGHTDSYIYIDYLGRPNINDMKTANAQVLELHDKLGLSRLLVDVGKLGGDVSFGIQMEGMRLLWQLRSFERFAFVVPQKELEHLVMSSLQHLNIKDRYRTFTDRLAASAWLESDQAAPNTKASKAS